MIIDQMERGFPWGLLVVEDESTSDQIPTWGPDDGPVTRAIGAVVLKVLHETDGTVIVHVARAKGDLAGTTVFDGTIDVPSGSLSIGDAGREQRLRIAVHPGQRAMRIVVDSIEYAQHVDLLID